LRAADVAFVTKARWDAVNDGYLLGAAELVIEIKSPSNTKPSSANMRRCVYQMGAANSG
jgi:hypothetical protein